MQTRLRAFYPWQKSFRSTLVFGYSNRSLFGLEIRGLGPRGKEISEKILYLSKELGLKIPIKRFVLCIEDFSVKELDDETKSWLELPILILFLSLASQIPIERLDDCFCSGRVTPSGKLIIPKIHRELLERLSLYTKENHLPPFRYLGPKGSYVPELIYLMPLESVLGDYSLEYSVSCSNELRL